MTDRLLSYYEKELAYIRNKGAVFAKEHPKIARHLGLSGDTAEDPHVSRLIESFAFLNARIHARLDADFPELTEALLSVVFPHYLRPIPAMAIVQFVADPERLDDRQTLPAQFALETAPVEGEKCRFTTLYPLELLPIKVASAQVINGPLTTPGASSVKGAKSVLKIAFETLGSARFENLQPKSIRLYLHGQAHFSHKLYEYLLSCCTGIAALGDDERGNPHWLPPEAVKAVGFDEQDGLLPYPENSFIGYRLLSEFFSFPQKFQFLDIDTQQLPLANVKDRLVLYFYFDLSDTELEDNVDADNFALGCTPAINLFAHRADPIRYDHSLSEYKVLPDSRKPESYEVYSVEKVTSVDREGALREYLPFYGARPSTSDNTNNGYWLGHQRPCDVGGAFSTIATDMFLSLVDLASNPLVCSEQTVLVDTLCSNGDLPVKHSLAHPNLKLQSVGAAPAVADIQFLVRPSKTLRPNSRDGLGWRLIAHLNQNALALTSARDPAQSLQQILSLYNFIDTDAHSRLIESVIKVQTRQVTAPLSTEGRTALCRGIEIEVVLDATLLSGANRYLFACVLDEFFALYCPLNSFTRTRVKLKGQEGCLKVGKPRSGVRAWP